MQPKKSQSVSVVIIKRASRLVNVNKIKFLLILSRFSTWRLFSREQAKSECDWLVMSSVFVTSQSSLLLSLFARTNLPSRKQALRGREKKQLDWLATNTDDITSQITFAFRLFARTNSPSGKPALSNLWLR